MSTRQKVFSYLLVSITVSILFGGIVSSLSCARATPPDWYVVVGSGVADESLPPGQRRLMALRAAKEDAWRQLLEAAKGLQIDARTSVRDFITQDDAIRSRVMGVIRGAQIVGEPRYLEDGTVEVEMRLDMNKIRHLIK
ncbi:LPP20 family lipoprotein [Candidatus Sumerlaeota bacterium]|nr:LPP20 family lipoprotein [Candidatus Sumerlaeota bacterium]